MPRAPTLEKTMDTLITLVFKDSRISEDDLMTIAALIKKLCDVIASSLEP